MDAEINKIQNELNFYRHGKLLTEICTKTMFIVYKLFYNWPDKCAHKLADHLDKIPANQANKTLRKLLAAGDITKLLAMKDNEEEIKGYDITFYYKLIQLATNNNKIKSLNDEVWNRNCPENRRDELEYLLLLTKNDRNAFNHKDNKFLNLKDEDIESFCDILLHRLPSIIRQTGLKVNADQSEIVKICDEIMKEIEAIRVMKEISSCDENAILKIMLEKYLMPDLKELKRCFGEELKSYCPPSFKKEGKIISTEKLLSDRDFQLICIYGEAGFGKTSFTKFVQRQLLLKIEKAGDDTVSDEIPIRIACRNITGRNVSEFLEDAIPFSRHYASSTSSLKKFLERFDIHWIIDGYDERTGEFSGFFKSLLKTLPSNHRIIITSRPDSLAEMKVELNGMAMAVCDVSIECFVDHQIKDVADKYLGQDKALDFVSDIQTITDEIKEFMTTPINLILCLELWKNNNSIFHGKLTTVYQLYDVIFEKLRNQLVDRHENKTNVTSKNDLKVRVDKWFHDVCAILAESPFGYELNISELQKEKLIKSANQNCLLGNYCLSTFFNYEKSLHGVNYIIKHKIQKEVLVCLYLENCDYKELEVIAQQDEIHYLLMRKNPFNIFKFLMECCSAEKFSRVFALYFQMYPSLQRPSCLLQIKEEKPNYFDAFKKQIKELGQLVLHIDKDEDSEDLINVIKYFSPDVKSFRLVINAGDGSLYNFTSTINDVLRIYKDRITLKLTIIVSDKNINILGIFKNHQKLIREIDIHFSTQNINLPTNNLSFQNLKVWYDFGIPNRKIKKVLNMKNLQNVTLDIDASKYLDSFLYYIGCPLSFTDRYKSCHVHFIIKKILNPSVVIKDLLKVVNKFRSISVDLELNDQYIAYDIKKDLFEKFETSSVKLKQLEMELGNRDHDIIWYQFVNCKTIETLNVKMNQGNDLQSFKALKNLIKVLVFDKLSELKEILFEIATLDHMNILLEILPIKRFHETILKVRLDPNEWLSEVKNIAIDDSTEKKFRKLEILKSEKSLSVSLGQIDSKIIEFLKSLTKSLIIYGVPYSSQMSNITADEQKIKDVAVEYLGDVEAEDFLYWHRSLDNESKQSMKIMIILKLCLQTWQENRALLKGKLTMYNLFDKSIQSIVELHCTDGTTISNKDKLKTSVEKWLDHLCKVVARIMFTLDREFRKKDEEELIQSAFSLDLIGINCMLCFFNHVESSSTNNYLFKDEMQKEVLAYFGLKLLDDSVLHAIAKDYHPKSIDNFTFLLEWEDSYEIVRVFSAFVKKFENLLAAAFLTKVKDENCFEICSEHQSIDLFDNAMSPDVIKLRIISEIEIYENMMDIINKYKGNHTFTSDFGSKELSKLDIFKKVSLTLDCDEYRRFSDIINSYKDRISFNLTLKVRDSNEFVTTIQMIDNQSNNNLIKELDLNSYVIIELEERLKNKFIKFEALENVSFYVDCRDYRGSDYYSASFLSYFASSINESTPHHLNPPQTAGNATNDAPLVIPTLKSFSESCHGHFNIRDITKPSTVIADLLKVNSSEFQSLSVDLDFDNEHLTCDLDMNLLQKFVTSSIRVKLLLIVLSDFSEYPNVVQLVTCVAIERLVLHSCYGLEEQSLSNIEYLLNICDFDKPKGIKLEVKGISPLILIYNECTSDILNKMTLVVHLDESSDSNDIIIVDSKPEKLFKQINVWNHRYLSDSQISQLRNISKSLAER